MVSLPAEKLETLIYQVGAISWSGKVSLGRTNGGETHLTFKCCPIVKKNLINQSVRKLPPFSQSNKIKVEKGRTQLLHSLKSLKIRSVGEKKGGGWEHPSTELGQFFFSTVFKHNHRGNKISLYIYVSLIIFLWQL